MSWLTRCAALALLALGVFSIAADRPRVFEDPVAVAALAVMAAVFGALTLRRAARRGGALAARGHGPWGGAPAHGFAAAPRAGGRGALATRGGRAGTLGEALWRAVGGVVVWCACLSAAVMVYDNRDRLRLALAKETAHPAVTATRSDGYAYLKRERGGHFVAPVVVNAVEVRMLVDTGSSDVALPYEEARRLGVDMSRLVFDHPVMTANGEAMVAPVVLPSVTVQNITLNDVSASVAEPGKLGAALLGMSFLGELSEVRLSGDELHLKQ